MLQVKWLRTITIAAAIGGIFLQSCKKENGIDNNNVIRTPYGLYFADNQGALYNTNDGKSIRRIFNTDGYVQRSIVTSGTNLLFVKKNVHLSTDNGDNFNPTDLSVNPKSRWESLMVDVPSHGRIYITSLNGLGIIYSEDHGKTWKNDMDWDTGPGGTVLYAPYPHTIAQLKGGDLFCYNNDSQMLYRRTSKTDTWKAVAKNGLPPHTYFLSHLNDALIATDVAGTGTQGVYFSTDKGLNWTAYSGLPADVPLMDTYAPFEQTLLVGTRGFGVYRLQSGAFVPSSNGLPSNCIVYSITAKSDTYKNEVVKQYIYAATNAGLYRSEDGGQNWILQYDGDIRLLY